MSLWFKSLFKNSVFNVLRKHLAMTDFIVSNPFFLNTKNWFQNQKSVKFYWQISAGFLASYPLTIVSFKTSGGHFLMLRYLTRTHQTHFFSLKDHQQQKKKDSAKTLLINVCGRLTFLIYHVFFIRLIIVRHILSSCAWTLCDYLRLPFVLKTKISSTNENSR